MQQEVKETNEEIICVPEKKLAKIQAELATNQIKVRKIKSGPGGGFPARPARPRSPPEPDFDSC